MGIYVHVPFCRNKCFYCGFYAVDSLQLKKAYLQALLHEMELRKNYLPKNQVDTLYFGGGTPSYLDVDELEMIMYKIHDIWNLNAGYESSIEMNPEDISRNKLEKLYELGFNRLTIGVQSFHDDILKRINRHHTAQQAIDGIELAYNAGFNNIGIDLIIGLPGQTSEDIDHDLKMVNILNIKHISVYILSIDSNSVFEKLIEKGKFESQDDDVLADQYLRISDRLKDMGYEHYEISNFAKEAKYSRHNTSYWQQKPYLGLGPAAHSFDLNSRQWNVAHLKNYIDSLDKGYLNFEKEVLTDSNLYNEYLMTNLRTMWGIDVCLLEEKYPVWWRNTKKIMDGYLERGLMISVGGGGLRLTEQGWLLSDRIFTELFV